MLKAIQAVGLVGSLALIVAGCMAAPGTEVEEGVEEAFEDAPLPSTDAKVTGSQKITFAKGSCNADGIVIRDGGLYRKGVLIGPDVTGITDPKRSPNGAVCHNTTVLQKAANYICNINTGGNFTGFVQEFDEWVDGKLVRHPAATMTSGLNYAFVEVIGPCDTKSQKDYAIKRIECCSGTPTAVP